MKEIWKDIDGYPNYMVSNMGRVKSLDRYEKCGNFKRFRKGIIKQPYINQDGYVVISLSKEGKQKPPMKISRLEAIAFDLPIPEEFKHIPIEQLEIDHIDTDKKNNKLENLRWTDRSGNANNPLTRKHISDVHLVPILQIDKNTDEIIGEFASFKEMEERLGFHYTNVSKCCRGKIKTAYGYKWSYK